MLPDRALKSAVFLIATLGLLAAPLAAQRASTTGIPTRMVVTVQAKHGSKVPVLYKEDVFVYEGNERDGVVDWMPLADKNAALELLIVVDDGLSPYANPVDDLRAFIGKLPPTTAVGIAYLRNGTVSMAQDITTDHARAAKAVHIPAGTRGVPSSPYVALANLITGWSNAPVRRQILFVSDGVDALFRGGAQNPYVAQAIAAAQKGNVTVYAVFARGVGYIGSNRAFLTWGQTYETQLAHATGGQVYFMGFSSSPSIDAYLEDVAQRMEHQFLLTFLARPLPTAGPRPVKLKTEVDNALLIGPEKVYVPAAR